MTGTRERSPSEALCKSHFLLWQNDPGASITYQTRGDVPLWGENLAPIPPLLRRKHPLSHHFLSVRRPDGQ